MTQIEIKVVTNGYMVRESAPYLQGLLGGSSTSDTLRVFSSLKDLTEWMVKNLDKPVESSIPVPTKLEVRKELLGKLSESW